jgi:hypothetical protein
VLFIEEGFDALEVAPFLKFLEFPLQLFDFLGRGFLIAFKVGAFGKIEFRQQLSNLLVAEPFV